MNCSYSNLSPSLNVDTEITLQVTSYRNFEIGWLFHIHGRTTILLAKLIMAQPLHGLPKVIPSRSGKRWVHFSGFMEIVHNLSFVYLTTTDDFSYRSRLRQDYTLVCATVIVFIRCTHHIDKLNNHRRCPGPTQSWISRRCVLLF
jgi:hypothetical protein